MIPPDERVTRLPAERSRDAKDETRVGPYRVIHEIGRGGMGAVYLAVRDDDAFQKRVALKILKRGMDTDSIVRRFRYERQILASLDHPNIAGLLDGGTTADGRPYFAMEFVEGETIVDYCEARELDTTARLELFRQVCAAVHYAHQNLIIHRDLKPANVLVTSDGTPKLLDFGIAKLLNPELTGHTLAPTVAGLQLMTPEYASPEQVRGETVTTATDVYSLGVLLYELLTGRRPYRLTSRMPADIARVVCEAVPSRPSTAVTQLPAVDPEPDDETGGIPRTPGSPSSRPTERARPADADRLRRRLEGDLDTIVLKALSKEPSRRYASVDQFSEDVRRHLTGLPVLARKDTLGYRVTKFVQRNRVGVVAAACVLVALVAGTVGTAWQARAARTERRRAEVRFDDVRALTNALLFELDDAIRDLEGSTAARQLLVSKGTSYLDKLSQDAGDRPDLRRELAAAYLKLGDVQGRPFNPNLGDTPGALASYQKASALYDSLVEGTTSNPALARERATAYLRVSDVQSSLGDTADALASARKALDLQREVTADAGGPVEARRELIVGYSRVGDLLSATGDTAAALEIRRTVLAQTEALAAAAPTDPNTLRQLGVAYQKLGNSLGNPNYPNVGDYEGALAQLLKSEETFRRAATLYPDNALFRRNQAVAHSNAADVLIALDRRPEALVHRRAAYATFEAQAAADPTNAAAKNDLAISEFKIAEMLDADGDPAGALPHFERALAIHQGLAAADPENASMKLEVASDSSSLGAIHAKLGRRPAALAHHTRAVNAARELSAANAENVELQVAVALGLAARGDAYLLFADARGASTPLPDLRAAEQDYADAVQLLDGLQKAGRIEGTDLETLQKTQASLETVRRRLAADGR